eukprot:gene7209-4593_t
MGARQQLQMLAFLRSSPPSPEECSLQEVDGMMFKLYAGNVTQRREVVDTLRSIDSRCPDWLQAALNNSAADLGVPACHVIRVYQKTRDQLPAASKRSFGLALLNMVNDPGWGSYVPFLDRYKDNTFEIDGSENHDMAKKVQQSLAVEVLATLPGPEFGPDAKLSDNSTIGQHRAAWMTYWRSYLRLMALHGINIEIASQIYAKY